MRFLLAFILQIAGFLGQPALMEQAQEAFEAEEYRECIRLYQIGLTQYPVQAQALQYNLAVAYLRIDSADRALTLLHESAASADDELASRSANMIGILLAQRERPRQAANAFRRALERNPANENARFNYEVMMRLLEDQEQSEKPPPDAPPELEDTPPDQRQQLNEELIRRIEERIRQLKGMPVTSDRGRPLGPDTISLSEARARLENLRYRKEVFLQQLRKSVASSAGEDSKKPNW